MKLLLASTVLATGLISAVPTMAQGVYIGPNGVGVDTGLGYRHRDYDRDSYRDYGRYGRGDRYYEGRSVSRGYRHHHEDDYDRY